jgi:hypothetical protein
MWNIIVSIVNGLQYGIKWIIQKNLGFAHIEVSCRRGETLGKGNGIKWGAKGEQAWRNILRTWGT